MGAALFVYLALSVASALAWVLIGNSMPEDRS